MKPAANTIGTLTRYPPSIAAGAVILVSAAGLTIWIGTSASAIVIIATACILSLTLWATLALKSKGFAHYLYKLHKARTSTASGDIERLEHGLDACGETQATAQLALLTKKIDVVRQVLLQRLDEGELTFHRYLGTAEQAYLSGLDNLREVQVAATARNGIDLAYIERRWAELGTDDDTESETERTAMREREAHHTALSATVRKHLAQNEAIMSALDNTAASMAHAQIGTKAASVSAEQAMTELAQLARNAKRYETEKR